VHLAEVGALCNRRPAHGIIGREDGWMRISPCSPTG